MTTGGDGEGEPAEVAVTHVVVNRLSEPVAVLWVDHEGAERLYGTAAARVGRHIQPTFSTHRWAFRASGPRGRLLAHFVGESSNITFEPGRDEPLITPYEGSQVVYETAEWGKYRRRGESMGVQVMAFDVVGDDAVDAACRILRMMLSHCPEELLRRLREQKAEVAIIARCQQTTDIPAHQYLKGSRTSDGRCFDAACRGLGGSAAIPTTSCGEENCTMVDDTRYGSENVLVHEFGHAVMNIGMSPEERAAVVEAFEAARAGGLYEESCYMMANADEYWAEAVQSWFHATERTDVNSGIKTRAALCAHDPRLAALLEATFGKWNHWRYSETCPGRMRPHAGQTGVCPEPGAPAPERVKQPEIVTIGGVHPTASLLQRSLLHAAHLLGETVCCFPLPPRREAETLAKNL
mmetsp:Transcript_3641/g.9336  ORF Transcript_3641/g.9336 Transcript_3641/m.9336 type:complete len:408 (+) Transcript_3641:207-1430(+)